MNALLAGDAVVRDAAFREGYPNGVAQASRPSGRPVSNGGNSGTKKPRSMGGFRCQDDEMFEARL